MSKGAQLQISKTRSLLKPNFYSRALMSEYADWAYDEERVLSLKGVWRSHFNVGPQTRLDVEIGTGNGFHFSNYAQKNPHRCLVGIELKYKPLIQSIRRCLQAGLKNARVARYNAVLIHDLFVSEEIDNVIIHFPDPWAKLRKQKHRLIQKDFLTRLYRLQREGSSIEFKTDSKDYFEWTLKCFAKTDYQLEFRTDDLHNSSHAADNFVTHFERLFIAKNNPIYYAQFKKIKTDDLAYIGLHNNYTRLVARRSNFATD